MIPAPSIVPDLSPLAEQWILTFQACVGEEGTPSPVFEWDGDTEWMAGQELLDAGLVARTMHADGRVTYRLTAAGQAWKPA